MLSEFTLLVSLTLSTQELPNRAYPQPTIKNDKPLIAKNLHRPEPGQTRGCTWSGTTGDEPTPDLIGYLIEDAILRGRGHTIKVIETTKSKYFQKGIISDQDPPACGRWKDNSKIVNVTVSSGKSELEGAFVDLGEKGFHEYTTARFGLPRMVNGQCLTTIGSYPVFDIASQVKEPNYDKTACDISKHGFHKGEATNPGVRITVYPDPPLPGRDPNAFGPDRSLPFTALFKATGVRDVPVLFAGSWTTYFYTVNPGFTVSDQSYAGTGGSSPRSQKLITAQSAVEKKGRLIVERNVKPGTYWITFAFRNILDDDVLYPSEPMKVVVPK